MSEWKDAGVGLQFKMWTNYHFVKEGSTAHNFLDGFANNTPIMAAGNAGRGFYSGKDLAGREIGTTGAVAYLFSAAVGFSGTLNGTSKGLATSYLNSTGTAGSFTSKNVSLTFGYGQKTFIYHEGLKQAEKSLWSAPTKFSSSAQAWDKLALGYPGSTNFGSKVFEGRMFGIFIKGTASKQGSSLGGGTQFMQMKGFGSKVSIKQIDF